MIKWRGKGINNRPVLGFGLSDGNIERLRASDPIYFNLKQLGDDLPDFDIVIAFGESEDHMRSELAQLINDKFK
jgi:hypothetical protein